MMYGLLESNPENRNAESPRDTTPDDIRTAVQLLRKKPEGIAVGQGSRGVFAEAKAAVYESLGIVARSGPVLRLSPLGWEMARRIESATDSFRAVLTNTRHYRAALDWAFRRCLPALTSEDVTDFWRREYPGTVGADDEQNRAAAGCFFNLCQAAALGSVGADDGRGFPSLCLDREELAGYLTPDTFPRLVVAPHEGVAMELEKPDLEASDALAEESLAPPAAGMAKGQTIALRVLSLALVEELNRIDEEPDAGAARVLDFAEQVRRFETALIKSALACAGGRQRRAARLLNMTKSTFNAKLKRYNIQSSSGGPTVREGGD